MPATMVFYALVLLLATSPAFAENIAADALFQEGLRFEQAGNFSDARSRFEQAVEQDPGNSRYRFELANVYAALCDKSDVSSGEMLARAAHELEQVVMLDPKSIAAYYNLGVVYKRQGRLEQAREQFRKVLAIEPQNGSAVMQIGQVYEQQGFFDDAREYYQKAGEMDFGNPDIQAALDDLSAHEKKAIQKARAENYTSMMMRRPFQDSPGAYQTENGNMSAGDSMKQLIPYMGSMLLQQFMKSRSQKDS